MKKFIAILMTAALMLSVSACKKDEPSTTPTTDPGSTSTTDPGTDPGTSTTPDEPYTGEIRDVTLRVWAPQNQIETGDLDKLQANFNTQNPQWKVTFENSAQGEDSAKDEILKDVTAAGDVYFFANDQIQDLVSAGAILPLGGAAESMVRSTMAQAVVDTVTVDGQVYGVPFTHNTFFMFYDKTLLDENDVQSLDKIMAKPTPDGVYNFHFDPAGGWKGAAFYYGAGLTIYGQDQVTYSEGTNWNNEVGVGVTNYLLDLMANPKFAWYEDVPKPEELAAEHKLGAWWDGSWNYQLYKDALGDNLGLAILPKFTVNGTEYQLRGFYGSKAIGINAQTQEPEVATAFAAFLGNEESQLARFRDTKQAPTNLNLSENDEVKSDEVAYVISQEAAKASVAQPTNSNFGSKYWSNAGGLFAEMRSGALTKDNAQAKLDAFAEALKVE